MTRLLSYFFLSLVFVSLTFAEPLDVKLRLDKVEGASYEVYEKVGVEFTANKDCYVTVYAIDTENRLRLLFPLNRFRNNFVQRNKTYSIPDDWDFPDLRAMAPEGLYYIQLVATTVPQDIPDWSTYHKKYYENDIRAYGKPEEAVVELNKKISRIQPDPEFYDESRVYFFVQERVERPVYSNNNSGGSQVYYEDDDDTHFHISIGYSDPYWWDCHYGYNYWDPFYWDYCWYPSYRYYHHSVYYAPYRHWYYYDHWYDHHHRGYRYSGALRYSPKSFKSKPTLATRSKNKTYGGLSLSKSYKNRTAKVSKTYKSKSGTSYKGKPSSLAVSKSKSSVKAQPVYKSGSKKTYTSSVKAQPTYKSDYSKTSGYTSKKAPLGKSVSKNKSTVKYSSSSRKPIYKDRRKTSSAIYSSSPKVDKKGYKIDRSGISKYNSSSNKTSYYKTYPNSGKTGFNDAKYKRDYQSSIKRGSSNSYKRSYSRPSKSSNKSKSSSSRRSNSSYKSSSRNKSGGYRSSSSRSSSSKSRSYRSSGSSRSSNSSRSSRSSKSSAKKSGKKK